MTRYDYYLWIHKNHYKLHWFLSHICILTLKYIPVTREFLYSNLNWYQRWQKLQPRFNAHKIKQKGRTHGSKINSVHSLMIRQCSHIWQLKRFSYRVKEQTQVNDSSKAKKKKKGTLGQYQMEMNYQTCNCNFFAARASDSRDGSKRIVVSASSEVTTYGSMFEAGRRSSKYPTSKHCMCQQNWSQAKPILLEHWQHMHKPFPCFSVSRPTRIEQPRFATPCQLHWNFKENQLKLKNAGGS